MTHPGGILEGQHLRPVHVRGKADRAPGQPNDPGDVAVRGELVMLLITGSIGIVFVAVGGSLLLSRSGGRGAEVAQPSSRRAVWPPNRPLECLFVAFGRRLDYNIRVRQDVVDKALSGEIGAHGTACQRVCSRELGLEKG